MNTKAQIRRIEEVLKNRVSGAMLTNSVSFDHSIRDLALDMHQALADAAAGGDVMQGVLSLCGNLGPDAPHPV